jgi:hypothetical protein
LLSVVVKTPLISTMILTMTKVNPIVYHAIKYKVNSIAYRTLMLIVQVKSMGETCRVTWTMVEIIAMSLILHANLMRPTARAIPHDNDAEVVTPGIHMCESRIAVARCW